MSNDGWLMSTAATLEFLTYATFLSILKWSKNWQPHHEPPMFADDGHTNDGVCEDGGQLVPRVTGLFQKRNSTGQITCSEGAYF